MRYGFVAAGTCGTGSTRVWRLLVGLLLTTTPARFAAAQSPVFTEFHTWTDVATIYNFSERWRYDGDYGLRGGLTDPNWTLLYLRPSVRYRHAQWLQLHGGAALFYNFFPGDDLPELRPWVGVRIVGPPLGDGWRLSNYFRMELRAFYLTGSKNWEIGLRGRWQVQVNTPRFRISSVEQLYALVSVEPFFDMSSNIDGTFGDRFRFNVGLGKAFGEDLRVDLNYLFHKIRVIANGSASDAEDHVVRLRFFYTIN
jgi:hypothetical protein